MSDSITQVAQRARSAANVLALATRATKDAALEAMADALVDQSARIIEANGQDLQRGRANDMSPGLLDRLALTEERILYATEGHFLLKTYERPDGSAVPTLAMGWPLVDDDGQTVCLIGVAVPIAHLWRSPSVMAALRADHPHDDD